MPIPINKKVNINNIEFCVKAKVTAVPTKGAEHGVAIKVAKKPKKKSEKFFLLNFEFKINVFIEFEKLIS